MNEQWKTRVKKNARITLPVAGVCAGLALLSLPWCATHHVVRTNRGAVVVSKRFVSIAGTFVDMRKWQWEDVDRHPDIRDALVQAGYQDVLPRPQGSARIVYAVKTLTRHTYAACCHGLQRAASRVANWIERADAYCFLPKT